jgi:hypothetical protein
LNQPSISGLKLGRFVPEESLVATDDSDSAGQTNRSELRADEQEAARVSRSEVRDFVEDKDVAVTLLENILNGLSETGVDVNGLRLKLANLVEASSVQVAAEGKADELFPGNQPALYDRKANLILLNPKHDWSKGAKVEIAHEMTHALFDGLKTDQLALIIDGISDLHGLGAQYQSLALDPQNTSMLK